MRTYVVDRIPHVLWDSLLSPGTLFSQPIGTGESLWGPGTKTYADTNLDIAYQLPEGWSFAIEEVRAEPVPPSTHQDLIGVALRLVLGVKIYLSAPADEAAIHWLVAATPGLPTPWMEYGIRLKLPLVLSGSHNFAMLVDGRPDVALRVSLRGELSRPVQ